MSAELNSFVYACASLAVGLVVFAILAVPVARSLVLRQLAPALIASQALAFFSPNLVLLNAAMIFTIPIVARQRYHVAPIYLFLLLTLPTLQYPLVLNTFYIVSYGVDTSLGIGALFAVFLTSRDYRSTTVTSDVLISVLWLYLVLILSRSTSLTNYIRIALDQALLLLLPYAIFRKTLSSHRNVQYAIIGLIAASMALSALAVFEALRSWPIYRTVYDHYHLILGSDASVKIRAGLLRSPGPFTEPTSFAFCLTIGAIILLSARSIFGSRNGWSCAVLIVLIGLLAPQSRGAWLGAVIGALALLWYRRDWGALWKQLFAATFAVGIVAVLSFLSGRLSAAVNFYGGLSLGGDYRVSLLSRGIEEFWKRPWTGASVPDVLFYLRDLIQGEGLVDFVNTYLFMALVGGIIGLVIFLGILTTPLFILLRARSRFFRARVNFRLLQVNRASVWFALLASTLAMLALTSLGARTSILLTLVILLASTVSKFGTDIVSISPPTRRDLVKVDRR